MSAQLIADAVRNREAQDEPTIWNRIYAFWLRRLVYTQIWEDPEADLAALQLPLGSTIVTISSGGCNALSYLTAQPAQVYAVDPNETHLALLKLKLAGIRVPFRVFRVLAVLRRGGIARERTALSRPAQAGARR